MRAKPWVAVMQVPGAGKSLDIGLGSYATAREAALVYDAEVRRREWEHDKPTNFAPPVDPADVPSRHESSAGSLGPVMIEYIKAALSGLHNPIVAHRVTEQGNGVYRRRPGASEEPVRPGNPQRRGLRRCQAGVDEQPRGLMR